VDAFTAEPFKGNPAAVCLLEDAAKAADERWMQSVAAEFNLSQTAFLLRDSSAAGAVPRFQLRWFTPATEVRIHPPPHRRTAASYPVFTRAFVTPFQVDLCGHATLASAHFLFTSVLAEHEALIEFSTKSGILTAKRVPAPESTAVSGEGKLFIELDFPMIDIVDCHPSELPSIPETLNGASIVSVHKSTGDLIIVILLILILLSCLKCLDFLMLLM
jgi:predicted PhzF superfamily epimerase YddE/YHI9